MGDILGVELSEQDISQSQLFSDGYSTQGFHDWLCDHIVDQ
jgi:hypothetical protein